MEKREAAHRECTASRKRKTRRLNRDYFGSKTWSIT
jgi:hypothetical protein